VTPAGQRERYLKVDCGALKEARQSGRRMRPDLVERAVAERVAKIFARAERHALTWRGMEVSHG
jgi:hypothetical protein